MIGAKTHTFAAQDGALVLIERTHVIGNLAAINRAEIFNQPKRNAKGQTLQIFGL